MSEQGDRRARRLCARTVVQTTLSAMPRSNGATSHKNGSLPVRSHSRHSAMSVIAHVTSGAVREVVGIGVAHSPGT
jgi:hypothetical protein